MKKILIIQTAFIGDVILATPLIEKLKNFFPKAEIDFLLRKGNEGLLKPRSLGWKGAFFLVMMGVRRGGGHKLVRGPLVFNGTAKVPGGMEPHTVVYPTYILYIRNGSRGKRDGDQI